MSMTKTDQSRKWRDTLSYAQLVIEKRFQTSNDLTRKDQNVAFHHLYMYGVLRFFHAGEDNVFQNIVDLSNTHHILLSICRGSSDLRKRSRAISPTNKMRFSIHDNTSYHLLSISYVN